MSASDAAPLSAREARQLLAVAVHADADELRAAYRRELLRTHPDHSPASDATERTIRLRHAYELLSSLEPSVGSTPTAPSTASSPPAQQPDATHDDEDEVRIELVDGETIGVHAPAEDTLLRLLDAAHRLGEVSYLDPSAGLIEVVVEFTAAPTSSLVLSLQGRSSGLTEVFCTLEPLSGGESPPTESVVALLARTLRGEDPTA